MRLIKKTKKGFTLVELIVVIAIVAILAAVSVVSYIAFINSANESADIQLVKQLNLALQADEALHGKRSTMHEMLLGMEENGFVVENLTKTKSGYDIVWDQEHNRFGLFDGEKKIYGESSLSLDHEQFIWKFVDNKAEADAITDSEKFYSMYLTEAYINETVRTLEVKSGVDVGINEISQLTYNHTSGNGQTVTIRTDNEETVLNVNGKKGESGDTVKHYGVAANVYENSCGSNSYDEYGYIIGYIFSKDGHVHVIQKSDTNISASAVVITDDKVSVDVEDETPVVYASTLTAAQIDSMQENINASGNTYIEGNTPQYQVSELEENTGGLGTEVSPYIIATSDKLKEAFTNSESKYYRLFKDITIDLYEFKLNSNFSFGSYFKGSFDGNNKNIIVTNTHSLGMNNTSNVHRIINKASGLLSNFTVINETGNCVSIVKGDQDEITEENPLSTLTFNNVNYGNENIDATLIIGVKNIGLYSQTMVGNYTFINCSNYYDIQSTSGLYNGLFVGGRVSSNNYSGHGTNPQLEIHLTFNGCKNYGDIFSYGDFGLLIGNANYPGRHEDSDTFVSNCYNYGYLSSFTNIGFITTQGSCLDETFTKGMTNQGTFEVLENDGTIFGFPEGDDHTLILKKGTQANKFKFAIYESFKVLKNNVSADITISCNITELYTTDNLTFVGDKVTLPFERRGYKGYDLWKTQNNNGNDYTGEWKITNEGDRYFFDQTNHCWVIDIIARFNSWKEDLGFGDEYTLNQDDTSTNTTITLIAYNDDVVVNVAVMANNGKVNDKTVIIN